MRAIYLDAFAGISGNMLLGAFLQAGVPLAHLEKELEKLGNGDEYTLKVSEVKKNGIQAVYVDVQMNAQEADAASHHHRRMADIRKRIETSSLSRHVKQLALAIFEEAAKAEGKVHGKPPEEVAFHEVGATDSIVDIVGSAICLDYLEVERVFASRLTLGRGFVACAHGLMPVPAPAVAELVRGWPTVPGSEEKELTTPTGAAFIRALATYHDGLPQDFEADSIAYGAGTWDLSIPNVLRLYLGSCAGGGSAARCILEANIDDMNPQIYGYLYDKLFAAGALDVWTTPIVMKKNRPAEKLSVLTDAEKKEALAGVIFRETTSIGLRVIPVVERLEASRRVAKVETKYGMVHGKVSAWHGEIVTVSAEYEDCRRCAAAHDVPLKTVQREAVRLLCERLGG